MKSTLRTGTMGKLVLVFGAAGALLVGTGASVSASDSSQNNYVVLYNQRNNSELIRTSMKIVFVTNGNVTAVNHAEAVASCQHCQTFAGAIEAVIAIGPVPNFKPVNEAYAVNYKCSYCDTGAYAGQINLGYARPVQLTERGQERVESLREQFYALKRSDLTATQMWTRSEQIAIQLEQVLRANLVPVDGGDDQPSDSDRSSMRAAA